MEHGIGTGWASICPLIHRINRFLEGKRSINFVGFWRLLDFSTCLWLLKDGWRSHPWSETWGVEIHCCVVSCNLTPWIHPSQQLSNRAACSVHPDHWGGERIRRAKGENVGGDKGGLMGQKRKSNIILIPDPKQALYKLLGGKLTLSQIKPDSHMFLCFLIISTDPLVFWQLAWGKENIGNPEMVGNTVRESIRNIRIFLSASSETITLPRGRYCRKQAPSTVTIPAHLSHGRGVGTGKSQHLPDRTSCIWGIFSTSMYLTTSIKGFWFSLRGFLESNRCTPLSFADRVTVNWCHSTEAV